MTDINRTVVAAIAAESLLVHGGILNGYLILFHLPALLKFPFPQVWRLVTPFLLTGGGFNALWDLYMFWQYTTQLELNSPRFTQPGDFATYVAFVWVAILVSHISTMFMPDTFSISNLAFLPGQSPMSEPVPGERGRLPLRDMQSIIRKNHKGLYVA